MIQVDEMVLRVKDMSAEEAKAMGENVAGRIASRLPDNFDNRQIDELNIKLSLSPGIGRDAMAERIATQILQQLKMI